MKQLYIRMFGEFSLQTETIQISERDDRSRKVWMLLAYLLTHRGQIVSRRTLIELLWTDDSVGSNPENSLKALLYRVRGLLNRLWPSAGHELILFKKDGYAWNEDVSVVIDTDLFETLCKQSYESEEKRIDGLMEAQTIYKGNFLDRLTTEPWVTALSIYYHNLYIEMVLNVIPLLTQRERHLEVMTVCKAALLEESYHEPLHRHLMQALIAMGDYKGSAAVYEKLSQKLFVEFGMRPSPETIELYRTALQTMKNENLSMDDVLAYLDEPTRDGAMECDYDYFKVLSRVEARSVRRTGVPTQIALLSVSGFADKELSKRSMDLAMEHLGEKIQKSLRQSDAYTRCSTAQYALMLPNTTKENGRMVCARIIRNYMKQYPNSPIQIQYTVNPLVETNLENEFR